MYLRNTDLCYDEAMKTILRKSNDRLKTKIDWLESYHTFSFGEHYDPNWMGFRNLRVINDDYIEGGQGFPFHPHRNMEIVTFMLNGTLRHQDSLGNNMAITPGELQVMSAGSGIIHSEYSENKANDDRVHLLQIWLLPKEHNIKPRYDQKQILSGESTNFLKPIASDVVEGSDVMMINTDATIYQGSLESGFEKKFNPLKHKNLWIHVFEGSVLVNDIELNSGDAVGIMELDRELTFKGNKSKASFLVFELI